MTNNKTNKRDKVDKLIDQFWKDGFLTLSRKYGKYLPEPKPIGQYDVDAVGKYKRKLAIGITITADDLNDNNLITKINFIAKGYPRLNNFLLTIFIGVPSDLFLKANMYLYQLENDVQPKIKLISVPSSK
ncbi:MAG: hypothetical protein WC055_12240 [Melioribacteraceae bacterium]